MIELWVFWARNHNIEWKKAVSTQQQYPTPAYHQLSQSQITKLLSHCKKNYTFWWAYDPPQLLSYLIDFRLFDLLIWSQGLYIFSIIKPIFIYQYVLIYFSTYWFIICLMSICTYTYLFDALAYKTDIYYIIYSFVQVMNDQSDSLASTSHTVTHHQDRRDKLSIRKHNIDPEKGYMMIVNYLWNRIQNSLAFPISPKKSSISS